MQQLLQGFRRVSEQVTDGGEKCAEKQFRGFEQLLCDFRMAVERWRRSQERTADDFNFLDVMQVTGRETMHSSVLAWLLAHDIEGLGTHAQGPLGLKLFLAEIGLSPAYASADNDYWVRTEVSGDESRIDVEVACRSKFLIRIETKIWSKEGVGQTAREWRDSERRAAHMKIPVGHIHAYFLSPSGGMPEHNKFDSISWSQIARVFEEFADRAKPPEVKMFSSHYARALRKSIAQPKETEPIENGAI